MFSKIYSAGWGLWAAASFETLPDVEKLGFAGLTVSLIYWITSRLNRQIDEQTVRMERLAEAVEKVAELVRDCRTREVK